MFKKLLIVSLLSINISANENIMTLGKTYEFAERNIIDLIREKIERNREALLEKSKAISEEAKETIKKWKPEGMLELTPAKINREFSPDMSYTLENDIKDIKGNIIYNKGYTFNPAEYVSLPFSLIVINANNPKELTWLENNGFLRTITYRILLSDGNFYDMAQKYKQNFYYLFPEIAKRFQLKHTPSIITQEKDKIIVNEICLYCEKNEG